MQANRRTDR